MPDDGAWMDEFDMSDWTDEARSAVVVLGDVLHYAGEAPLSVTVQAPLPAAASEPAAWRDVVWLTGRCRGYLRQSETAIALAFGDGDVILDFSELLSYEESEEGGLVTLCFTAQRLHIGAHEDSDRLSVDFHGAVRAMHALQEVLVRSVVTVRDDVGSWQTVATGTGEFSRGAYRGSDGAFDVLIGTDHWVQLPWPHLQAWTWLTVGPDDAIRELELFFSTWRVCFTPFSD